MSIRFSIKYIHKYLSKNRNNQFVYGQWDCLEFILGFYSPLQNLSIVKNIRGKYKTKTEYQNLIKENGYKNLHEILKAHLKERPLAYAQFGNIAYHNGAMGIVEGLNSIFLNKEGGYTIIQTNQCTGVFECLN
jgi:hypothetical protein